MSSLTHRRFRPAAWAGALAGAAALGLLGATAALPPAAAQPATVMAPPACTCSAAVSVVSQDLVNCTCGALQCVVAGKGAGVQPALVCVK